MERHPEFKYLASLDGYACSTRLEKLLAMESAVLKQASTFSSYFYQAMQPYVHYVPFWEAGPTDILDAIKWVRERPLEARRIARAGRMFAKTHLQRPARLCYWRFLLMREYAKLLTYKPSLANYPNAIPLEEEPMMHSVKPAGLAAHHG
eukprot:3191739-Pyramimonas_sp.AAC.1